MHPALTDAITKEVRQRSAEGDCPTIPAQSVGMLEDAILDLAGRLDRYRAAMEAVCAELEEEFDTVDGGDGQPAPNKAMRLASELKEAIYGPGGF